MTKPTFSQRCRERAGHIDGHTSWKYARIVLDQDVPELCRRLDRAVEALRERCPERAFGKQCGTCWDCLYANELEADRE